MEEFALYDLIERTAKKLIPAHRNTFKPVCANVDFYSGFVYTMLGIPQELFTPLFAIARMLAGVRIAWKSSLTPERSSVRLINMWDIIRSMCLWKNDKGWRRLFRNSGSGFRRPVISLPGAKRSGR